VITDGSLNPSKRCLSASEIAELLRIHYALQKGAFISEWEQMGNWLQVFSSLSSAPMWNHLAWLGGTNDQPLEFASQVEFFWNENGRRPTLYLVSDENRTEADHVLLRHGFQPCDQESWMFYDPSELPDAPESPELEVRIASDPDEISSFSNVFCAAYQVQPEAYRTAFRPGTLADSHGRQTCHYLGYQADRPVCIASLLSLESSACIYNVGTLPEARKKGYAAQLIGRLIRDCQAPPRRLFLQTEQGSTAERLYERLGFAIGFVRTGYRLTRWEPSSHAVVSSSASAETLPDEFLASVRREDPLEPSEAKQSPLPLDLASEVPFAVARLNAEMGLRPETIWLAAWANVLRRHSQEKRVGFDLRLPGETNPGPLSMEIFEREQAASFLRRVDAMLQNDRGATAGRMDIFHADSLVDFQPRDNNPPVHINRGALLLDLSEVERGKTRFEFEASRFDRAALERLGGHFVKLALEMACRPGQTLGSLEMLSEAERDLLLGTWAGSRFSSAGCELVHRLFEQKASETPEARALWLATEAQPDRAATLTYRELDRLANRWARRLSQLGAGPEKIVGLCLERSLDMVVGLLAVLKAGGVCLALDPASPKERTDFMVADAQPAVILSHRQFLDTFDPRVAICYEAEMERLAGTDDGDLEFEPAETNAAYIIYTSGSTGKPKGVVVMHRAIASHCQDVRSFYGFQPGDRVLQFNSFTFDAAFEQILSTLISGATLVLRGPAVWNPKEFRQRLDDYGLTVVDLPTAYWHQVLEDWSRHSGSRLRKPPRLVIVGGEAMSPESLRLWAELPWPSTRLINAYGPTEATITATAFEVPPRSLKQPLRRVPIGRPRGDRRIYLLDDGRRPVPRGAVGELHIGGPLLARGYLNRPDLTGQKFVRNPFSSEPCERLYKTGDLARYLADGNLDFLGRADQQVKIRGYRVELGEIELTLQQHPTIREAAVILREGSRGERYLAAHYAVSRQPGPTEHELRDFLRKKLPEYMIPASFAQLEALPLLPSGKVNRQALGAAGPLQAERRCSGPETPLELQLQLLFERVLGRRPIGVDVSFFELGGDSLQALELVVDLERISGKELPLDVLYQNASVQALARLVQEQSPIREWSSLVPLQTGGRRAPLFLVHTTPGDVLGYGNFIYHLDRDLPCYGFQSLGLSRPELSQTRIEEMARYYIELMRAMRPNGPYSLGGWCYGGLVAFEMARQLQAKGQAVAFLGLLETVAPPPSLRISRYYLHRFRCFLRMSPRHWLSYLRSKLRYYQDVKLANRMRFRRLEHNDPEKRVTLAEHNRRLARLEHVYATNLQALKRYRPKPYPGKVTLFNAEQIDQGVLPDPQYAWTGLAGAIEVHAVPGDHDTMLTEPNVAALARCFDACLRSAEEHGSLAPELSASPPTPRTDESAVSP
jgi:amino acid adenylation domain-containing protein